MVCNDLKCTKKVYEFLLKSVDCTWSSVIRAKWEEELCCQIKDETWNNMYYEVKQLTNATKLHFFQYRIINRYLVTNVKLAMWIPAANKRCTFCNDFDETILHLLVTCKKVQCLWGNLAQWLEYFCFLDFHADPYIIIFNIYKDAFLALVNT